MEELCPGASQKHVLTTLKKDTDWFWFDGASNVQKAVEVLTVYYPRARVFHGSEHVLGLYFSDVSKLPPIRVRHVVDCHFSFLTTVVSYLNLFFYAGSNIKIFPIIQRVWLWFKSWDLRNIHCTDHKGKWGKVHWPTQGCRDQVFDLVLCNASRTTFGRSSPW